MRTTTRQVLAVCFVWGTAFALVEAAFLTRMNELLPLGAGHFWLVFFLALGFSALAMIPPVLVVLVARLGGTPKPKLLLLSGPWFLLVVLAVSYYRQYGAAAPRSVQGNLTTIVIVAAMFAFLLIAVRWIRDASQARRAATIFGAVLGLVAGFALVTASLPTSLDAPDTASVERLETKLRVLLVGLDGVTWDIVDPLIERGELPAFAELKRVSVWSDLETVIPTFSPPIWTSIASGQSVAQHGIFDHTRTRLPFGLPDLPVTVGRERCLTKPVKWTLGALPAVLEMPLLDNSPSDLRAPRLWGILSQFGLSSIVLEWYVTHPVERIEGVMVSEQFHRFGNTRPGTVYPPELAETMVPSLVTPEDISDEMLFGLLDAEDLDAAGRRELEAAYPEWFVRIRGKIARDETTLKLLDTSLGIVKDWRLSAVFYKAVDAVHHLNWADRSLPESGLEDHPDRRFRTAVDRYYRFTDKILSKTLELAGEDTVVIVVSDHGWDTAYGGHNKKPLGIFAMLGGPTASPTMESRVHIYDIAPTVLALLGLPVGEDMPGKVTTDFVDPEFWGRYPIRHVPRYIRSPSDEEDTSHKVLDTEEIDQLRALGYVD